jgi:hypothetical protein
LIVTVGSSGSVQVSLPPVPPPPRWPPRPRPRPPNPPPPSSSHVVLPPLRPPRPPPPLPPVHQLGSSSMDPESSSSSMMVGGAPLELEKSAMSDSLALQAMAGQSSIAPDTSSQRRRCSPRAEPSATRRSL